MKEKQQQKLYTAHVAPLSFFCADLFQLVDVYDTGLLTHDEMFRIYKLLFGGAISDDHILDLTFRALQHPDLNKPGEISQGEFFRVCCRCFFWENALWFCLFGGL